MWLRGAPGDTSAEIKEEKREAETAGDCAVTGGNEQACASLRV